MAAAGILALIIILSIFLYVRLRDVFRKRAEFDRINGPRTLWPFGNVHQFKVDSEDFFEQAAGLCVMYSEQRMTRLWFMCFPYLLVYGAELAEPIFGTQHHLDKSREYELLRPWLGTGLLTAPSGKWRPRRKLLTPTFHYDILKDFVDVFNQEAKILVGALSPFAGAGAPFDMWQYVTRCTLDIICESAMGRHVGAQLNPDVPYVRAVYRLNEIVHQRHKAPWLWVDSIHYLIGRGKEQSQSLEIVQGFTKKVIRERHEQIKAAGGVANLISNSVPEPDANANVGVRGRRMAFLDLLLDMVERGEMPMEDVQMEVDTFMFEGHDTTSAGMNWLLQLLANNPQCQDKVHAELDMVLGASDRSVTFDDLGKLVYLEWCIKEALRLYPSVPIYSRRLGVDTKFGDRMVPEGTVALLFPYMLHRDPKHWPDPEIFDPERFSPAKAAGRHPFAYVPFSAGSRNCIGQRFAIMEMKVVIAWVLRHYRLSALRRRDQMRPKGELILRPMNGVWLVLEPRRALYTVCDCLQAARALYVTIQALQVLN